MAKHTIAFVKKCLGIQSPSALWITGGRVKYMYDLIKMKRSEKQNDWLINRKS